MIQEKSITIGTKEYIISKLPATVGREILFLYPTSNIPKIGDYGKSQEIMLKLMSYVQVQVEDKLIPLNTESLVNNHVPNAETLLLLEKEMFKYNFDFFTSEKTSNFLNELEAKATDKAMSMLTNLLERLSQVAEQHSTN